MNFHKESRKATFFYGLTIPGAFFIFFSLFGMFGNLPIILFVGILFFILYFAVNFYDERVHEHLELKNDVQKIRLYPGEEGEITFTLLQRGFLPIIGAKLIITYDRVIDVKREKTHSHDYTGVVEIPLTILSFEEKKITIPFEAIHRGVARIRSVKLNIPNLLGLGHIYLTFNPMYKTEVIVYPTIKKVNQLDIMEPKRNGEHQSKHSIFEQPILPVGTRDYIPGDSFNRIHWKASARQGQLQTKIVEKVNQLSWLILINVRKNTNETPEYIEEYLKHVAYIAKYATELNIPLEIYMNIPSKVNDPFYHLPLGQGKNHYMHALETLARVNRHGMSMSYSAMVRYIDRRDKPPYIIQLGDYSSFDMKYFKKWLEQGHSIYTIYDMNTAQIQPLIFNERGEVHGTGS
ncbi:DUF58 domain-containing protein [Bacillaceae bacterium W0354]